MAGHSKWANIQHRKGAQDAKRGRLFTKLIREVSVAARQGGPDADANPRLRNAIDKALAGNVPKDTIERAVKRAAGELSLQQIEEIRYEGYGPGGAALMVDCMTDNRNRTAGDVRHAFSKCGGNLGTDGSVAFLFSEVGQLTYSSAVGEDRVLEAALEAGADDAVTNSDGSIDVLTTAERFSAVREAMLRAGLEPERAEVTMRPSTTVDLDADDSRRMLRLFEMLDELDDVQQVYSNAEISDEIIEETA